MTTPLFSPTLKYTLSLGPLCLSSTGIPQPLTSSTTSLTINFLSGTCFTIKNGGIFLGTGGKWRRGLPGVRERWLWKGTERKMEKGGIGGWIVNEHDSTTLDINSNCVPLNLKTQSYDTPPFEIGLWNVPKICMGLEWRKKKGGGVEGVKDFVGGVVGECELEGETEKFSRFFSDITYLRDRVFTLKRWEEGTCNNRLSSTLQSILLSLSSSIAQLEGEQTVNSLYYYLLPSISYISQITSQIRGVENLKGGEMLNSLEGEWDDVRGVYEGIMDQWCTSGILEDKYEEFCVRIIETREDVMSGGWDEKFQLVPRNVPEWMGLDAEAIVRVGKYLSVVRECGGKVGGGGGLKGRKGSELKLAFNDLLNHAGASVMNEVFENHNVKHHLDVIRKYILLGKGDFFNTFMDYASTELEKPKAECNISRLRSLLSMSLPEGCSVDLSLSSLSLLKQLRAIHSWESKVDQTPETGLKGVDTLVLSVSVDWPVSLIVSEKSVVKYQLVFRLIFFGKWVERKLLGCWEGLQGVKGMDLQGNLGLTHKCKSRMLHFITNFTYYVMSEVIQPQWHVLEKKLSQCKDIDDAISSHQDFLDGVLKECLLTNRVILEDLIGLMKTCLLFCEEMENVWKEIGIEESLKEVAVGERLKRMNLEPVGIGEGRRLSSVNVNMRYRQRKERIAELGGKVLDKVSGEEYKNTVARYVQNFDAGLSSLLSKMLKDGQRREYQSHVINLCQRLDFNGFWSGTVDGGVGTSGS
ncbi:hypothetical protein TrLO_g8748 [Triparma laevis f. longispina]|nr:hypothetical protein TrLO_g8748 [Triparma laevis f. longispina]